MGHKSRWPVGRRRGVLQEDGPMAVSSHLRHPCCPLCRLPPPGEEPMRSVVTGANRGLGLEFVRQLLARGDEVVAACRQPGKATDLNRLAGAHPGRLHVLPLDVADERSRVAFAHELPLVADGVDLLINNAGVLHSGERWGHLEAAILEDSLRINAVGPLLLTQALDSQLADGATVATLSSMMSSLGDDPTFN